MEALALTAFLSLISSTHPRGCAPFAQSARVTIKVSDRSSMDPTTKEREVSIAGPYGNVKLAEAMVAEKLAQSRARAAQGGPSGGGPSGRSNGDDGLHGDGAVH